MTTPGKALAATCNGCSGTVWAALDEDPYRTRAEELAGTGHSIDLLYVDHIPAVRGCRCGRRQKKRRGGRKG